MDRPVNRVVIIGAGPCGISLLRAFALAEEGGTPIPELMCFEKSNDWGGLWNFDWRTGVDEHGDPVHGTMYRHLWSNVPKEYHEFPDYSYNQHFKKPVPTYLSRQDIRDYVVGRVENSNIRRYIQFNTAVKHIEFDPASEQFRVRVLDLTTKTSRVEEFDRVVVATGHFSTPNVPHFEGVENFPGRVLHSRDFRDAREFRGQNLLVVGGSYSAEDIAVNAYKFGVQSVTISYRSRPLGHKWPEGIKEVPLVIRLDGRTAHFTDGTQGEFDAIVFCTGYRHHFPFLDDNLQLVTKNRLYPDNLYKGVLLQNQPRVAFVGMQKFYYSFPGLDAQIWYIRDVLLGRITVPVEEERRTDAARWQAREEQLSGFVEAIDYMGGYVADLLAHTDYPPFNVAAAGEKLKRMVRDKADNILRYRDQVFTSHYTGTTAAYYPRPWLEMLED